MSTKRIDLDWTRLLGFDQANPGPDPLRNSPKIGEKDARGFAASIAEPLHAKVGQKPDNIGALLQAKVGLKPDTIGALLQAKVGLKPAGIGAALQAKVGSKDFLRH